MKIHYTKLLEYPFEAVLSQYFDYEHIEHVHPKTLGRYRLLETRGNVLVYEQTWPRKGWRQKTSVVEHEFLPPNEMWFRFVAGRYKGVKVFTKLEEVPAGTRVEETHFLPLPPWNWLRKLIEGPALRLIERIWEEDLVVDVCRDGWPGIPGQNEAVESFLVSSDPQPPRNGAEAPREEVALGTAELVPECGAGVFQTPLGEVAVFRTRGRWHALANRCPHSGGPLALGRLVDNSIVCPWHGARFDLESGNLLEGPGPGCVNGFKILERSGSLHLSVG